MGRANPSADADRRLAAIVRQSSDIVSIIDADATVRYQSPSIWQVMGYGETEWVGSNLTDILHPDDREWVLRNFETSLAHPGVSTDPIECRWRHRDGSYRLMQTVRDNQLDHPDIRGIVLTTRDITERRALETELKHRAFHDGLTGVANRALLEERLAEALAAARRGSPQPALAIVDLDDFKGVNDTLGHAAGNRLLVEVAMRLTELVRDPDTVARLGGDEFAVLFHMPAGEDDVVRRTGEILTSISAPYDIDDRHLRIAASAGVVLRPGSEDDSEDVLGNADLALYRSKQRGKSRMSMYDPSMRAAAVQALELEADVRRALGAGELELHYQPLYTRSREIAGLEALLRWRHPERGLLAPGAFLEAAERSRLIVPIGRWVLREACSRAARWTQAHPKLGQVGIGVNVSAEQLREPSLVDDVRTALEDSGLPPRRLILEITETAMMQDLTAAATMLERIKALGVSLALDDFGTGYSSLSYLQQLPLDFIKVPRAFIKDLGSGPRATELARGIVSLGCSLGLKVAAEGVETEAQWDEATAIGCHLVQGFLMARPMPPEEIDGLLDRQTASQAA